MNEKKMIAELTPEQEAQLPVYKEKWINIGLRTGKADIEAAKKALVKVYAAPDPPLDPPKEVLHMPSPQAAAEWERNNGRGSGLDAVIFGAHDASWLGFYDYWHSVVGIDCSDAEGLWELAQCACWCWVYEDLAIVTDFPEEIHFDEQNRLHREDGPALTYSDGFGVWAIHGVRVPEKVVMAPETLTMQEINAERNAEVMRVMIERVGAGKYMEEMGAKAVGEPFHGSQLYEMELSIPGQDETITMARVRAVNSTPEPDGTSKIYWLKVPPGMSCAQEALAAIHPDPFRKSWRDYAPTVET